MHRGSRLGRIKGRKGDNESEFGPSRWTVKQLSMVTKHKSLFLCRASQKHSMRVKGQEPVSLTLP